MTCLTRLKRVSLLSGVLLLLGGSGALCQTNTRESSAPDRPVRELLALPYAFYSDTYSLGFGAAIAVAGYGQEQLLSFTTLAGSVNGSLSLFSVVRGARIPSTERLFLDTTVHVDRFTHLKSYVNGNPAFPEEQAGSNGSSPDNYILGRSLNFQGEAKLRYVLPLGEGRDSPVHTYYLQNGLLKSGATGEGPWNPLRSGRTYVHAKPFYRRQTFGPHDDPQASPTNTNGVQVAVEHHHEDFESNPTKGSRQRFAVTRDAGLGDSSSAWSALEGEFTKYISLGPTKRLRQQVLVLDAWTAAATAGRPPYHTNAVLGGLDRLRAFSADRFHDQAAVYYSAEYRMIPYWRPRPDAGLAKLALGLLNPDWWQTVVFGELGSVSPRWDAALLHKGMKWDAGIGIRVRTRKVVLRCDSSFGTEGGRLLAGVSFLAGQPF